MSSTYFLKTSYLGLTDYDRALSLQHEIHDSIVLQNENSILLGLEHPNVLTLGKHAALEHVLLNKKELERRGVHLVRTDRGGEVTAHIPGQLVMYPLIPIKKMSISPRDFLCRLEGSVIELLARYGVDACRDADYPGIWVGDDKICAVGLRIKNRVSMHGLALNVSNKLDLFNSIVPCGIKDRGVCSLFSLKAGNYPLEDLFVEFSQIFAKKMGFQSVSMVGKSDLLGGK